MVFRFERGLKSDRCGHRDRREGVHRSGDVPRAPLMRADAADQHAQDRVPLDQSIALTGRAGDGRQLAGVTFQAHVRRRVRRGHCRTLKQRAAAEAAARRQPQDAHRSGSDGRGGGGGGRL